jgi:5-methylcytosine-specific restriction protein A
MVSSNGTDWGKVAMWGLAVLGTYKFVVQPLLDEEYASRTLPASVRERLKLEHIEQNGSHCPNCGLRTSWSNLVVDHILPFAKGGRTSIQNSQILCRWCNTEKSDSADLFDMLRGRGSRPW